MSYVDGFVIPIKKKKVAAYKKLAKLGLNLWMKHGATAYYECIGDDLKVSKQMGAGFGRTYRLKAGETVIFAFIVFKSKAHRNKVNSKVMKDPAMASYANIGAMPFTMDRFCYGGFKTMVSKN